MAVDLGKCLIQTRVTVIRQISFMTSSQPASSAGNLMLVTASFLVTDER